jgi:hypothetical protein
LSFSKRLYLALTEIDTPLDHKQKHKLNN